MYDFLIFDRSAAMKGVDAAHDDDEQNHDDLVKEHSGGSNSKKCRVKAKYAQVLADLIDTRNGLATSRVLLNEPVLIDSNKHNQLLVGSLWID